MQIPLITSMVICVTYFRVKYFISKLGINGIFLDHYLPLNLPTGFALF